MYNQCKEGWQEKNITNFTFFWWVLYKMGHTSNYAPSVVHWCRIYRIWCTQSAQHPHTGNEVSPVCSLQTDGMGAGVWLPGPHVLPTWFPPHFCDDDPPRQKSATKWDFNDVHNCTELRDADFTPRQAVSIRDSSQHSEKRLQTCVAIRYIHRIDKPPPYE